MSKAFLRLRQPGAPSENRQIDEGGRLELAPGTEVVFVDPALDRLTFRAAGERGSDLTVELPDGSSIILVDYIGNQLAQSPPRIVDPANSLTAPTTAELLESSDPAIGQNSGDTVDTHGRTAPLRQFAEPDFGFDTFGLNRIGGLGDTILEFPLFLRRGIETLFARNESAPPMGIDDSADVSEDGPATSIAVLANDTDVDGDPLTVIGVTDNGAAGTATFTSSAVTFDPAGAYESLASGATMTESLTYTVSDGNGGTDTANVVVTVIGQNDPPVGIDDGADVSEDGPATSIAVLANDTDVDGDPLTVIGVTDNGAAGTATFTSAAVTFDPAGAYESLSFGQSATESLTYTVSDGNGGTDTANVTVTIIGQDEPLPDCVLLDDVAAGTFPQLTGYVFEGENLVDFAGYHVSSAGDVNGDGFDDILIGARDAGVGASPASKTGAGYIVFGGPANLATFDALNGTTDRRIDLDLLNGTNGFVMRGPSTGDELGYSVSHADLNGDGISDLILGARDSELGVGANNNGEIYVVFGGTGVGGGGSVNLAGLNGTNGYVLRGINQVDFAGTSVSSAGDVNGDEIEDFLIGAVGGDSPGANNSGEGYLIFGGTANLAALDAADGATNGAISLSTLMTGANAGGAFGFVLRGITVNDNAGRDVTALGDINGDGVDDFAISSRRAGLPNGSRPGATYVVFGGDNLDTLDAADGSANGSIGLDQLNGTTGYTFLGIDGGTAPATSANGDGAGISIASAGDVNGDSIVDMIIGAAHAEPGGGGLNDNNGEAYIVYGGATNLAAADAADGTVDGRISLGLLNGTTGFALRTTTTSEFLGLSVFAAGDMNGDGFGDLIVGAPNKSGPDNAPVAGSGRAYIIFGAANLGSSGAFDVATIDGLNGIVLKGNDADDLAGFAVSAAGDVDGDGFDDVIVGAPHGDSGGSNSGEATLVFGGNFTAAATEIGGTGNDTLTGTTAADVLIGDQGDDTLDGMGGADVLKGGAGNDRLIVSDATFAKLDGGLGQDTLVLADNLDLDLTNISNLKIESIEAIDMENGTANTLTLNLLDVFDFSETNNTVIAGVVGVAATSANTLLIDGDSTDTVNLEGPPTGHPADGGAWQMSGSLVVSSVTYDLYEFNDGGVTIATVLIEQEVMTVIV